MIIYESYALPLNPILKSSASVDGLSFIRSEFEFATRQRATFRQSTKSGFGLILRHHELIHFEQFWSDINFGADQFQANFIVHGSDNVNKVLRFTNSYSLKPLGRNFYEVSGQIEILNIGTPKSSASPLVPYETLYPSDTLIPLT